MNVSDLPIQHKVILAAAGVTTLAAFLPWASAFGISVSGIRGDGILTLIFAVIGALVILARRVGRRGFAISQLILGGLVLYLGIWHTFDDFAAIGIYLTLLAGFAWIGALAWWWLDTKEGDARPPTSPPAE